MSPLSFKYTYTHATAAICQNDLAVTVNSKNQTHTVSSAQHQAVGRWDVSSESQPALIYQQQQVIPETQRQHHPKFRDGKVSTAPD